MTTWRLECGDYREVLRDVTADTWISDCPYSAKTHSGNDSQYHTAQPGEPRDNRARIKVGLDPTRSSLPYAAWTPDDVRECVEFWAPRTRGWMVSLTDDVLFPVWRDAMRDAGRVVFQDVPAIITGMTVRLSGDGPSSWAIHCVVSRPRSREFATWGTLPGGYTGPSEPQMVVGGKPLWLLRALVRDYSRPGQVVVDSCAGGATTGVAALMEGRHFIGSEIDAGTHAKAHARLSRPYTMSLFATDRPAAEQSALDL